LSNEEVIREFKIVMKQKPICEIDNSHNLIIIRHAFTEVNFARDYNRHFGFTS